MWETSWNRPNAFPSPINTFENESITLSPCYEATRKPLKTFGIPELSIMKTIQMACRSHLFLHLSLGFITLGVRQPPATAPEPATVPIAVTDSTQVADESSPLAASLPEITRRRSPSCLGPVRNGRDIADSFGRSSLAISIIQGDEMVAWGASGIRAFGTTHRFL